MVVVVVMVMVGVQAVLMVELLGLPEVLIADRRIILHSLLQAPFILPPTRTFSIHTRIHRGG